MGMMKHQISQHPLTVLFVCLQAPLALLNASSSSYCRSGWEHTLLQAVHLLKDLSHTDYWQQTSWVTDLQYSAGWLVLHFMHQVCKLLHPLCHNPKLEQQAVECWLTVLVAHAAGGLPN